MIVFHLVVVMLAHRKNMLECRNSKIEFAELNIVEYSTYFNLYPDCFQVAYYRMDKFYR